MYYCFIRVPSGVKYYFTGKGFDTLPFKLKSYKKLGTLKTTIKKFLNRIPDRYNIYYDTVKSKNNNKKPSIKKNPIKKSKWSKLKEASKRYEDFSGHTAKFIDEKDLQKMDVGFKIGVVDFIGYTTKRDGRVEKYIHKFKKNSRPVLASNYDGKFISLVNGKYRFTDRGIVDNN